ncbi:MAG: class I SAM-dependent methyltransferase [Gammaproteobacteria bacterium]|nr:class I SAM-dependent methyltransferase [Gammaproteobacteria bacterium]
MEFKDHFSNGSADYDRYRPSYPPPLYRYLATLCADHESAWDCATGTGQSALLLAEYFSEVAATDASSKQVSKAKKHPGVRYFVASAEASSLPDQSLDLITVAQALHWFDLPRFTDEVKRVLKPEGVLAAWSYNLLNVTPAIDEVIETLYHHTLGSFWPAERKAVEQGYRAMQFPLREIEPPDFHMSKQWDLPHLIGYLSTWSAVKAYRKAQGADPLDGLEEQLSSAWGEDANTRQVTWPLTVKVWVND